VAKISDEDDKVFRVSLPGYDVHTAEPEECAIHSGFDYPKIEESLEGYTEVTIPDTLGTGDTVLVTINHNYGYIPFWMVYMDDIDDNFETEFAKLPYTEGVPVFWLFYVVPSTTQLKICVYNSGDWGDIEAPDLPAGIDVGFKWACWVND
jgi:hypothetical protein